MDSKGYTRKNADNLKKIDFITRVPNNFELVSKIINQALRFNDQWHDIMDIFSLYRILRPQLSWLFGCRLYPYGSLPVELF